ncbi:molybdopterin-guanine dinucleotide biosynthesis protein B [Caldanaerovirga acetigignens]|uniref:Molybdopterin-guanine dinucleotide biosynthesis protein B n=1 Tax=Caldanaerovirga acetigignens TaxID=447595 RepID=A0A1M7I7K4_9FIRM|nr:hypothetical protein [Caldanaerovirga acetigignens]SHM36675.1 molybdopterin-guanine dinucleotide biosynthesis protein B [Caldanaerovirga acetigignens]
MKVFSVVGLAKYRNRLINKIAKELKVRGYTVGVLKNENNFINNYEKIDDADIVAFLGRESTAICFSRKLSLNEIMSFYKQDFVILEDVSDAAVPKLLCAESEEEIEKVLDGTVFAISGAFSIKMKRYGDVPVINAEANARELVDLIEERVFEKLPDLEGKGCGSCGKSCGMMAEDILKKRASREDCRAKNSVNVWINGREVPMVPFVQKTFEAIITAFLSQLKGFEKGDIKIVITVKE